MQIGSRVSPAQDILIHPFQTRRARFQSRLPPLDPLPRPDSGVQPIDQLTREHLFNLEQLLLSKEIHPTPFQPDPVLPENRANSGSNENRGNVITEWLGSLTRIWPEKKTEAAASEDMSPIDFINFQRLLLSKSASEYSPRNNLSLRWRQYHGCHNWAALLDPLDQNLRREVVRYGEFVQAAYQGFYSEPALPDDQAPPSTVHVLLSDKSYKVTKSLYATSSVGLPGWVQGMAGNNARLTQRSSQIGYVAVCDDFMEIQRMGRRDIVIALRGTITYREWTENLRDMLVRMPNDNDQNKFSDNNQNNGHPKAQCGFLSLYNTRGARVPSLAESVVKEVQRLIDLYKGETLSITVTGHSLGAALALLVADGISTCAPSMPPVAVFSFGGPRVGNRRFADRLNTNIVKVLRIVNDKDLITRVPGMFVSEQLDQKLRESGANKMLNILDNNMPWAYSHVGTELRVDTKKSPYLKANADVACCHDLEAYLHLVDGFMASNSPFRADAKRSLAKLLDEQRSNVKRLFKGRRGTQSVSS